MARAAPRHLLIHTQLKRLVDEAVRVSAESGEHEATLRRIDAIGERIARWQSHLPAEDGAPYRKRYEEARAVVLQLVRKKDIRGEAETSIVELDSGAASRRVDVASAVPRHLLIHTQLKRLVDEAVRVSAESGEHEATLRRIDAIGERIARWQSHLPVEDGAPYRKRYKEARAVVLQFVRKK